MVHAASLAGRNLPFDGELCTPGDNRRSAVLLARPQLRENTIVLHCATGHREASAANESHGTDHRDAEVLQ